MNKLEDIVPPLELCKQIPQGTLPDSSLVWTRDVGKSEFYVAIREDVEFCRLGMINAPPLFPAPTLAEILDELGNKTVCLYDGIRYEVSVCIRECDSGTKEHQWRQYGEADRNPASAALRMWLRIRREAGR